MPNKDFQNGLIIGITAGSTRVDTGNVGYQVKFKVDGNDYYVASCRQGESITEPPMPTKQGYNFSGWKLNNANVEFPYTPNEDIEFNASFTDALFLVHFDGSLQSLPPTTIAEQVNAASYNDAGKFGKCLNNTASTRLSYTTTAMQKTTSQSKTIECWVKASPNANGVICYYTSRLSVFATERAVAIQYNGSLLLREEHNIGANVWYHIAIVFGMSQVRLYINGMLLGTANQSTSDGSNRLYIYCDASASDIGSPSVIDEFAIFDGAKYTENFTPPTAPY